MPIVTPRTPEALMRVLMMDVESSISIRMARTFRSIVAADSSLTEAGGVP